MKWVDITNISISIESLGGRGVWTKHEQAMETTAEEEDTQGIRQEDNNW